MSYRSAIKDAVTLDFETEKILKRPHYPPNPVGLAIRWPNGDTVYRAWGHPTKNNCTVEEVKRELEVIWASGAPLLFFNAKFDLAVAYEKFGMPKLPWDRVHDAMFLAFLFDPHARKMGLKPLAENILDWPPEEQDAILDFVYENRRKLKDKHVEYVDRVKAKICNTKAKVNAGPWICKCPVSLIGPYAIGDVDRTWGLFEVLYPDIINRDMLEAYDRERRLMPILMENEEDGIYVDLVTLRKAVKKYNKSLLKAKTKIGKKLGITADDVGSRIKLAQALTDKNMVDEKDWKYTPKGSKSVNKDDLPPELIKDRDLGHLMHYRNRLQTSLGTFLRPWLVQAEARNGLISTSWNQVAGEGGGTRTGRPSSKSPNFLNIPKKFKKEWDMPKVNKFRLLPLPDVRWYIIADPGHVFLHRDFDGQEMRVFAHYEDGELLAAYQEDPDLDPHKWVGDEVLKVTGKVLERTAIKAINFQGIYGGGINALSKELKISEDEAREFKAFHNRVLPGLKGLTEDIKEHMLTGEPIVTWGGREYYTEEAKWIDGEYKSFEYKLINYLCQGSAADITKEALIRWYNHPKRDARFLVTVYDEINISARKEVAEEQMALLREVMEGIKLDLVMKSSGKIGPRWGELKKYDDRR